jgi:bifunctional UDP-N-acetylglucosamine pyrophosphorylase/glucosamine-1-phosphate N-acetyltransferase
MLPVGDSPLVERVLDAAAAAGASQFIMVVGYEASAVRDHFGDAHAGVPVTYATQANQRGTADAVQAALPHLEDDSFAVLNGDALYSGESLRTLFAARPAVGAYRVENPSEYGVLAVADGVVRGVTEKPADPSSDLINVGAYVLPAAARRWLDVAESERGEYELTDTLARVCAERTVTAVPFDRWLDVGHPWDLLRANELVLGDLGRSLDGDVSPDAELRGSVVVETGATVRERVTVEGPARICAGASVGPNAYVRGATLVGPDARVGHAVEVKNSVLMRDATVGHLSYVGDSVLGRDVNFGAGTTVANLRHDDTDVRTQLKGETISTGRRKFGVVCGDGVKTGIQTTLNAGIVLPTDGRTSPGESVTRTLWSE